MGLYARTTAVAPCAPPIRYPGRDEPDRAAKIHVAVAPVYYHNYVLGRLIAAQLRHYLEERVAGGAFFMTRRAVPPLPQGITNEVRWFKPLLL